MLSFAERLWSHWLSRFRSSPLSPYKKFIKYILVGLMGLSIDLGVMIVLVEHSAWQPQVASSLAFIFSSVNNFVWHKFWTFRDPSRAYLRQYSQFALTALVGLVLNYFLMGYLLGLNFHYVAARLIAIVFIVFWNFFINSCWAFKSIKTDLSTTK